MVYATKYFTILGRVIGRIWSSIFVSLVRELLRLPPPPPPPPPSSTLPLPSPTILKAEKALDEVDFVGPSSGLCEWRRTWWKTSVDWNISNLKRKTRYGISYSFQSRFYLLSCYFWYSYNIPIFIFHFNPCEQLMISHKDHVTDVCSS